MVTEITDEEIASLAQSILTRYGIDFTCYEPKSLRRRILHVMNIFEMESIHHLWIRFLRDQQFIYAFMDEVSVGMTSMFRDPILWRKLKDMLPTTCDEKKKLTIWHAGCSTGEEVYSMGILLKETSLQHKCSALATDMNQGALATARTGTYHKFRMIENAANYKEYSGSDDFAQYYMEKGKEAMMQPELINHVSFSYHHLISDAVQDIYDIIFCRNVMIYFDARAKAALLEKLYNALSPGGYLIIGFYDTILSLINHRKLVLTDEEAKIFRKI
jgi:chemotaxis protein methyltransferase CheR